MSHRYVIKSDSCGERVYLRMTKMGWGKPHRYGLMRDARDATTFRSTALANVYAHHAEQIISRVFEAVRLGEEVELARLASSVGRELVDG